jgi:predicted DNA-binding transcriptional regulator YafY
MQVEVLYASAHGKSRKWRRIMPHALAWSGHRWHARAWCLENLDYRDFVLGRMEDAHWPEAAPSLPLRDAAWETMITVEVRPHQDLEEEAQAGIANEFRMEKGHLLIPVRQAMVQYLETALGLAPAEGLPRPPRLERVR